LSAAEALLVLIAGLGAGTINAVIGSGTLITFPVLLAVGYPPVVANVSNNIGLLPGAVTAVHAYREELAGQRARLVPFITATALGSFAGSLLLLALPESAFEVIVPVLIAGALVLVALQPRITAAVIARRKAHRPAGGPLLRGGIFATGVYGGYFGAAQGILLFALLGTALPDDQQVASAFRILLAGINNGVAAVVFLAVADVSFAAAGILAIGSSAGGVLGARVGRRLRPATLRIVVVVVGLSAIAHLAL
jgi:hypothetical protein